MSTAEILISMLWGVSRIRFFIPFDQLKQVTKLLLQLAIYSIFNIIYNIYLHPLCRFPGPKFWQCNYFFRFKAGVQGTLEESIKEFHERYGPVVRYSPSELSFTSPAAWKDIYGFHEHALPKDPSFYGLIHLSRDRSHSIFTADKEQHPRVRKSLSSAFSERALRDQEPFVKMYVDLLIQRLGELAAGPTPKVDLVEWYNFTTFDIIGDLAIAQSFDCLRGSKYHEWVHGFWNTIKLGAFVRAMAMSTHSAFPQLLRALAPRSLKDARRRHLEFVGSRTEQRLSEGIRREKPDFISYVLKSNLEQAQKVGGVTLSDGEIEANINFLLLAGTETTATALSGTTYYLLKNREALRRATEEVRNAFKREEDITFVTAADRLPYVQACLAEGLRIYPPGPIGAPRRTPKGTITMIAGHAVPGDVTVGVHAWSASHSPENFHQASEFIPERWLLSPEGSSSSSSSSSPFRADRHAASQPFSYGPRNCLGKPFAYNEMRMILARVLWNFDLRLSPESDGWEKQKVYTLWDKGQLMVRLNARQPISAED
jgi:cytochrome P450